MPLAMCHVSHQQGLSRKHQLLYLGGHLCVESLIYALHFFSIRISNLWFFDIETYTVVARYAGKYSNPCIWCIFMEWHIIQNYYLVVQLFPDLLQCYLLFIYFCRLAYSMRKMMRDKALVCIILFFYAASSILWIFSSSFKLLLRAHKFLGECLFLIPCFDTWIAGKEAFCMWNYGFCHYNL